MYRALKDGLESFLRLPFGTSWIVLIGMLLGTLCGALIPTSSVAQDAGWRIPSSWSCMWSTCATFYPQDGSPPRAQSFRHDIRLDRPGRLRLPSSTTLERPATQQRLSAGPGTVLYLGGSSFQATEGTVLVYVHQDEQPAPLELLLPTLMVSPEGTEFVISAETSDRTVISLLHGRLWVKAIDAPLAPGQLMQAGDRLTASSLSHPSLQVEKGAVTSTRGLPRVPQGATRGDLQARAQAAEHLKRLLEGGGDHLTQEDLNLLSADLLPDLPVEQQLRVAESLAQGHVQNPTAGRVLFELWSQQRLQPTHSAELSRLEALIREAFSETVWPSALSGVLILEATRRQVPSTHPPGSTPQPTAPPN